jgi:hypothetical protein
MLWGVEQLREGILYDEDPRGKLGFIEWGDNFFFIQNKYKSTSIHIIS